MSEPDLLNLRPSRRTAEGENFWQDMMTFRTEISQAEFEASVIVSDMLDEGETFDDFTETAEREGDPCRFFKTGCVFHIAQAGFEWIFKPNL